VVFARSRALLHAALVCALLAGGTFLASPAAAAEGETDSQVIDFESGDFARFPVESGGQGEIVTSPVRAGRYAARYVMTGNGRSESAGARVPVGQDMWAGWSLNIPEDFPSDASGTVSQFIGYQPPCHTGGNFHLKVRDDQWGTWLRHRGERGNSTDTYDLGPVRKGEWSDILVHARWTSGDDGFFELYVDGELLQRETGPTFVDCPQGPYFKAGIYAGAPAGTTVYMDEYRMQVGGSCADVAPDPAECPGEPSPDDDPTSSPTPTPRTSPPPAEAPDDNDTATEDTPAQGEPDTRFSALLAELRRLLEQLLGAVAS
jgi:hypothetical protein